METCPITVRVMDNIVVLGDNMIHCCNTYPVIFNIEVVTRPLVATSIFGDAVRQ